MSPYRTAPDPLPSMRRFLDEAVAAAETADEGTREEARTWAGMLSGEDAETLRVHVGSRIRHRWPALALVIEEAFRDLDAKRAAARAPLPHLPRQREEGKVARVLAEDPEGTPPIVPWEVYGARGAKAAQER